jgi:hypothetical protein
MPSDRRSWTGAIGIFQIGGRGRGAHRWPDVRQEASDRRRPRATVVAVLVLASLAGCSAETDPASDVTYHSATLHAKVHCDPGEFGEFRYAYRVVSSTSWHGTAWTPFSCTERRPASGTVDIAQTVDDLADSAFYEFRGEYRTAPGEAVAWVDGEGKINGTAYDVFATGAHPTVPAGDAGDLYDTTGVNTRTAYTDTPWGDYANLKEALRYTGIKRIRDGIWPPEYTGQYQLFRELARMGIRATLGLGDAQRFRDERSQLDAKVAAIRADPELTKFIDAFDSPNEPDHYTPFPGWPLVLLDYQEWLASTVTTGGLAEKKIVGPTFVARAAAELVGDIGRWIDFGGVHPYPGGERPGPALFNGLDFCRINRPAGGCQFTEVGYHNEVNATPHDGVPESIRKSYELRHVLEARRNGVREVDINTLVAQSCATGEAAVDDGSAWGLYDCHWNPRPIAHALHNFLATVGSGRVADPAPVKLSGADEDADVRRMVLRQPDGDALVILWRDVSMWDRHAKRIIDIALKTVTFRTSLDVRIVRPTEDAVERDLPTPGRVELGGEPVILVLRPRG